ncbi:shikimate kinase [Clostridium acetobutylicum]|uniref:Shikimate kinase n=1 Tax=Clostridium acetobutylicum (strain ATCC 824 / DSM 792 / JCM 1419 / IAM 19013 / LMG 5710 / NBRC 13948 / NRRL B-527 / VKM B-1787 / 2291 / W) TaxID=272562 RepID=Q97KL9_CLOAB|nr:MULTISPECIES: shikimate kinase [Clostridium]AAK78874.1 Shikimate kinase [Clostridium acetobutylicum ATCC 824]ADZ19949.1 Shikimate kinase [Clostridium acetobutylicum EA 2018]AEI33284.1 shikimate kinase [Clostridium acetobutylicum DSM 1731]AWV80593.1 shikimate kinase [Clostridium acetobutylicum]MBC2392783.1 shikimate kinase [Clostridium acetobutylicum]
MNLVLIGMPGCGKSTIGKILSKELNMKFYDADKYLEDRNNMKISDMFKRGEEFFRNLESAALKELSFEENSVIATGGGAVTREKNILCLKKKGKIVFINRPPEKIMEDVDIENRPLLEHGKSRILKLYEERYKLYINYCDYQVLNDGSIDRVVLSIKKYLEGEGI